MSKENMVKYARTGNLVRFQRAFETAIKEKIPAVIERERSRVSNLMFNRDKE